MAEESGTTPEGGEPISDPGGGEPTVPPAEPAVDLSAVHEDFAGKTPEQVSREWAMMKAGFEAQARLLESVRQSGMGAPAHARPTEPAPEPKDKPKYSEMIYEDEGIEQAVVDIVARQFGPQFLQLITKSDEAIYIGASRRLPEFDKYEPRIKELAKELGSTITPETVDYLYKIAYGEAALDEAKKKASRQPHSQKPTPKGPEDGKGPKLEEPKGIEGDVWRQSGMSLEEWYKYRDEEADYLEVPTGAAR